MKSRTRATSAGQLRMIGRIFLAAVAVLATVATGAAQGPGHIPSVLLLFAVQSTDPARETIEATFRQAVESSYGSPVDLRVEYLDLPNGDVTPYEGLVTDILATKYENHPFDAVVAHRSDGLRFALTHRQRLFPGVPVIFIDIVPQVVERLGALPPDVTGVANAFDTYQAVRETLAVRPGTRSVVLVGGASDFDRRTADDATQALQKQQPPVQIVSLMGLPLDEQLRQVSILPEQSLIIVPSYRSDTAGRSLVGRDIVRQIASAANVPTFGYARFFLGAGIVGGQLVQYDVQAERAAAITARLLKGEPVTGIPQDKRPTAVSIYDWRELQRWHIDQKLIPAGAAVLFREQTLWSEYRVPILIGVTVLLGQGVLIGLLLLERRRRRAARAELLAAEERYRTVANFTAEWEYWLGPEGTFRYVSPSCLRITGYEAAEFMSRPSLVTDLFVEAGDRQAWQALHRPDGTGSDADVRIRTRAGELKWIGVAVTAVLGPDGRDLGVRGSARDITARKQAEADTRQALAQVQVLRDQLEIDNSCLREEFQRDTSIDGILGGSDVMQYVVSKIQRVAPTSSTVLLLGETGVGKSQLARAIHNLSPRRHRAFVTLNCAALPPALVESELFGHERGAFTGAHSRRVGRFEAADGGTLFLDEIGELAIDLQSKLLRAVQDGVFERVGSNVAIKTDARLIVATNRPFEEDVRAGRFRQDLWYRLNVFPVTVPPLRQRPNDIPVLATHFIEKHCRKLGRPMLTVSKGTMRALQTRTWQGNVRELESIIERTVISSQGPRFELADDDQETSLAAGSTPASATGAYPTLDEIQRKHIFATLQRMGWRVEGNGGTAEALGVNASTLRSRMRKLGIQRNLSRSFERSGARAARD